MEKILEKASEEITDVCRERYFDVCNRRILFYNQMGNSSEKDAAISAYKFLCSLTVFECKTPRKIIKERFENFKQAKDLAEEVMKKYL